jgi:hypothetical protein
MQDNEPSKNRQPLSNVALVPGDRLNRLFFPLIYSVIVIMLGVGARVIAPLASTLNYAYRCPFKTLTGHPCPTCGMTRMFAALGNFDLRLALSCNPLFFLLALTPFVWLLVELLVPSAMLNPLDRRFLALIRSRGFRWLGLLTFLLNWLYLIVHHV